MKTKLFFIILLFVSLTSCVKDYYGGGPSKEEIVLTSENYLYEGDLEKYFIEDEILSIDAKVEKLKKVPTDSPDYKDAQAQVNQLEEEKSSYEVRLSEMINLSAVLKGFPIPCDLPNGKCVPVRLEFFLFNAFITKAEVLVKDVEGKILGVSATLIPFPEFESELQYLKIPVIENQDQISIIISKMDALGNESIFETKLKN
ncbi:hypothetical protein LCGC14_1473590 [marine sediment metagenome]|uniref:Lipoprotein n=2 Tax=root TaxID=1 RepID=A0A831QN24_9FLAO|nr:hypothetical protein [Pricia antarctica]